MSSSNIKPLKTTRYNVAVIDRNAVSDTISTIKQHGCHHSLSKERHQGLSSILYFVDLEFFEKEFKHSLLIDDRVHDGLGDKDGGAFGVIDSDLFEGIFEQYLHIFPVFDDTLGSGIAQL